MITKTNIRKITSLIIGLPAAIIAAGELKDARLWWVQFVAIATLALIIAWNVKRNNNNEQR